MQNDAIGGIVGGILGGVFGIVGGLIGTYFSIRNTQSSRERSFVIKTCMVFWTALLLFLSLMFTLPQDYRWMLWIPYAVLLSVGIIYFNRGQQAIRQQETPNAPAHSTASGSKPLSVQGS